MFNERDNREGTTNSSNLNYRKRINQLPGRQLKLITRDLIQPNKMSLKTTLTEHIEDYETSSSDVF